MVNIETTQYSLLNRSNNKTVCSSLVIAKLRPQNYVKSVKQIFLSKNNIHHLQVDNLEYRRKLSAYK